MDPIAPPTVERVLLAGDTHGSMGFWTKLVRIARRHQCDVILQLGDFGFWPDRHGNLDRRYLTSVANVARQHHLRVRVIDGNHDDHPAARAAFPAGTDLIRPIVDGTLDWADRGARWQWGKVRFGALGGAVSTDRFHPVTPRTAGKDWWPTEQISDNDVAALGCDELDVLVAHDAPAGVRRDRYHTDPVLNADDYDNRRRLRDAVNNTRPALVVHGHHHQRLSDQLTLEGGHVVQVEGLAHGPRRSGLNWAVLDLNTLAVNDTKTFQRQHTGAQVDQHESSNP